MRHSGSPGAYKWLMAKGADQCSGASYGLSTGATGGLHFIVYGGDGAHASADAGTAIWDGQWHAIAGSYDGTSLRIYVDGAEVGTATPATTSIRYGLPFESLNLGNYPASAFCAFDYAFPGDIDEAGVYRRALEAAEVAGLHRADLTTPPGLPVRPDPAPPRPAPVNPENVAAPVIRSTGDGAYTCDPGTWRNLPSPPDYEYSWLVYRNFVLKTGNGQSYTPDASDYGWPAHCQASVAGTNGRVPARSATGYFGSSGLDKLIAPYGDVRVRGIDVFQVVQPTSRARMFGYKPDGTFAPALCGGGTPTNWRRTLPFGVCDLEGRDPQQANYEGVTLDSGKTATAVVYVDMADTEATDKALTYDLLVYGARAGVSLGDPVVVEVKNPLPSDTPYVRSFERDDAQYGVQVRLPSAWTSAGAAIQLTARLKFPDQFDAYGTTTGYGTRQCDSGCLANDVFTLRDVSFQEFPQLLIGALELRQITATPTQVHLPTARSVLSRARELFPGGSRMVVSPYRADLDITAATILNATAVGGTSTDLTCNGLTYATTGDNAFTVATATRDCREAAVAVIMAQWITDHPARTVSRSQLKTRVTELYDIVMGVHDYAIPGGAGLEPGTARGDITTVSRTQPQQATGTPYFHATSRTRPLTAAAHELGHVLTAPHNGTCNDAAGVEPWAADGQGRLQGVKFAREPVVGPGGLIVGYGDGEASVDGPYEAAGGGTANPTLFDLMSYCGGGDTAASDGTAWLSARNWNRFARELGDLGTRVGLVSRPRSAAAAARSAARAAAAQTGPGFAVGTAGPAGGQIARVVPPDGQDAVPEPVASSPYVLRSLSAGARVLLEAGIVVRPSSEAGADGGGPFSGPVAPGAVAVELLREGTVLHRLQRSRPPTVRLSAPKRGARVRGGGLLEVRWQASDPDRDALAATVDFSPDGGRTWRTVHGGPSDGRATVPAGFLAGSKRARLRVSISDGFSEGSVTSGAFTVDGIAPQPQILSPQAGSLIRAGERIKLAGSASDDRGRQLTGKALTWFAGRKRLGTGARLSVALPSATRRLRLVARDAAGLQGSVTLPVRVTARRLHIVAVDLPNRVAKNARTVTVRIRASAPATLTAAGRRFRVRTGRTRLVIPLPSRPGVGVVRVPFRLSATSRAVKGTVEGVFSVVRT